MMFFETSQEKMTDAGSSRKTATNSGIEFHVTSQENMTGSSRKTVPPCGGEKLKWQFFAALTCFYSVAVFNANQWEREIS